MIYVDSLFRWEARGGQAFRTGSRHGHRWCHLWCDPGEEEELHRFAAGIGCRREWFQAKARFPHYDLTPGRRLAALRAGATEKSLREWMTTHRDAVTFAQAIGEEFGRP